MSEAPQTLGEALHLFRRANGLGDDEGARNWWQCRIGPVSLALPNFAWRRRAIAAHDLHHVLTGFPCSMRGECHMASWEFGAGRMPHWGAYLFCLPLVIAGVVWSPASIFRAFAAGRRSASLHGSAITEAMLAAPLPVIRSRLADPRARAGGACFLFALLLLQAFLVLLIPAAIAIGLAMATHAAIR